MIAGDVIDLYAGLDHVGITICVDALAVAEDRVSACLASTTDITKRQQRGNDTEHEEREGTD